jgi:hypothetical protein
MPNPFAQFAPREEDEEKDKNPFSQFAGPQRRKKLQWYDAALSGAGDSLSFGFGDEIQGGLAGAGAWLTGGDYWDAYNKSTREARSWQDKAAIDEGGWKFAGELGGAVLGGLATGGGAAVVGNALRGGRAAAAAAAAASAATPVRNMGLLSRMGRSAAFAAPGGALYGAGVSDGGENGDMLANAAMGGAMGALSGPLLEGAGIVGKRAIIDPILDMNPSRQAAKHVMREMNRYGLDAAQIQKNAKAVGDVDATNAWTMDAFGKLGSDLVSASSASAGPELAAMQAAAKLRNVSISEGARDNFWKKLGGGLRERINYVSRVSDIDTELSNFDTVYGAIDARRLNVDAFPKELKDFLLKNAPEDYKINTANGVRDITQKPVGPFSDAMNSAVALMRADLGTDVPAQVLMDQPKFWRTFLTMARKSKEDAWRSNDSGMGEVRSKYYNQLKNWLGDDNVLGKDWVKAQERYAALKTERDGLEFGFKAVMQTDPPVLADNLKVFNNMDPTAKKWARKGMIARLEEGIRNQQTRGSTRDMLRKVADNPSQREALGRFFARVNKDGSIDNRFTKLTSMLEDLDLRYGFFDNIERSGILKGPKTAHVLTQAANQADQTLPAAGEILKGNIFGALKKIFTGDSTARFDEDVANEIIKFMRAPASVRDKKGVLVGGLEHQISAQGLQKWLNGPSVVQKALKRQMQLQKAYKDRWSNARGSAYAGVGGGSSLELLGLFGLGQSGDADEYY